MADPKILIPWSSPSYQWSTSFLWSMWNRKIEVSRIFELTETEPTTCPCGIDSRDCTYHKEGT